MRILVVLVAVAAVLWGGYWFVGAHFAQRGVLVWLEQRRAAGWVAEAADVSVAGFPSRFDLTVTEPALTEPSGRLGWSAPFVQVLALSYRPNAVILALPDSQTVEAFGQRLMVTSTKMQASLLLTPLGVVPLMRSTLVADGLTVTAPGGWSAALDKAVLASERMARATGAGPELHRIGAEIDGLRPDARLLALVDPDGTLPPVVDRVHLDATIGILQGSARLRPMPASVALDDLSLRWGALELSAAGQLSVGASGVLNGKITLRAAGWRQMLDLAGNAGLIDAAALPGITRALQVLAAISADPERLELPLTLRDGLVTFGVIPLMNAPRLTF